MASEALWAGIAGGAEVLSEGIRQDHKNKLLEAMEKEREARAEERQLAKENRAVAREAKKVAETRVTQDSTGSFVRERLNSMGEVLAREPLTGYEIDQLNREAQKEEVSLEKLLADADLARQRAQGYGGEQQMKQEMHRARLGLTGAQTQAARARAAAAAGGDSNQPVSEGQAVISLLKDHKEATKTSGLSSQLLYTYAQAALRNAAAARRRGQQADPGVLFMQGVAERARRDKALEERNNNALGL